MNSTLKRVLFGMVLVVVGVLGWHVTTEFQTPERPVAFSDFLADVDSGKVEQVTITGQAIAGIYRTDNESFWTLRIDQEIKRIVSANYERAHRILVEYKAVLVNIADELLTREVLDGEQVRRMVRGLSLDEPPPAASTGPAAAVPDDEDTRRRQQRRQSLVPLLQDPLPQA